MTARDQRPGFERADHLLNDSGLSDALEKYEKLFPEAGHIMRWHLDHARELFTNTDVARAQQVILHGDFAPWNILYQGEMLSGIIDFEAAHLNFRVSDFALAWRGHQDDVIVGYEILYPLPDTDRALIIPAFWSWLFRGVRDEIQRMDATGIAPDFTWQIKKLLLRSAKHPTAIYPN